MGCAHPLMPHLNRRAKARHPVTAHYRTANSKGYICIWEISGGQLFLTDELITGLPRIKLHRHITMQWVFPPAPALFRSISSAAMSPCTASFRALGQR
ncbi:MAG: hypothetical protein Q4G22_12170 [Paracoccus sp. (in: a-proteobacteria)]|uniref:hypothetical protein n=1 Tax=Paracoccus sp. TaxID=267 RepID=UPI0026DF3C7F|nr:hypothetical protein [Paracoccus sp. (in: a-proteobacteria)]MDO5632578.1 hypothetical protein [Paracoccus sp. (in: a-proteobacteria)]